ncbi:MAG: hypothetical protein ACXVCX_16445, partial [Ktedonobacterales bacterium]
TATRKDGQPCVRPTLPGSDTCVYHDPRNSEWRAMGGKATRRSARVARLLPDRLRPVVDTLLRLLGEVHDGDITPSQASAMAAVAGAIIRALSAGEMEQRLRELERRAAAQEGEMQPWQQQYEPAAYPTPPVAPAVTAEPAPATPAPPAAAAVVRAQPKQAKRRTPGVRSTVAEQPTRQPRWWEEEVDGMGEGAAVLRFDDEEQR